MPEKIEIIYNFIKEGEEKMEEYKLKNLSGSDARKILECADQKDIDIEKIIDFIKKLKGEKIKMTDLTNDEKRFTEEEKKVQKYMSEHKGVSYRDSVLACLDRSEPEPKKEEFTEEQIKERENLKAVENYLSANPRATYSDAVKILFKGEKPTLEEKLIEEYQKANPKATYKEAVIESLSLLRKKEKEE